MRFERTNTILYCRNWAETVAFYRDVFAFPVHHETDWFVEFQLSEQAFLSIANEQHATIRSVNGQGITLSWQVQDLANLYAFFQERHITVSSIRKKWGALLFYLHDPEGHRIELWEPIEQA